MISEIDCEAPPDVEHTVADFNDTSLGSLAEYTCQKGYRNISGGVTSSTCADTEQWSSVDLVCECKW